MDEIETIRRTGVVTGEKRYIALEAMRATIEWFKSTKPSELLTYEEGSGKGAVVRSVVEEPRMRELWQKWADAVTRTVFDKGSQIPDLLMDDVIQMFRETATVDGKEK